MFVRLLLVTVLAYICFFNLNPDHCYAFGKKHGNDGGILSRKKSGEVKPDDEIDESRISIGIDDSIGDILRSEDKLGKSSKKFHIKSKSKKGQDIVEFDAVEATPAVTPETIISYADGEDELVGETGYSLLVADPSSEDGTFAIVSVNTETNEVQGFLQKKNLKAMKISQHNGQASFVEEDDEFTPPAWTCRVSEKTKNRSNESLFERALQTNTDHRHQLEYGHYHHDENMEDHAPYDPEANFEEIRKSLRGSKINFGDRRKLQSGGESYSYQVNMFIQVDQSFVNKSGGQAGAIQYVNTLITAANTVYEQEIDTHLHVAVFSVTSLYDSYNDVDPALDKMVATYKSGTSWQSAGIDLQHAFIGRSIGGGLAYVGVICDTSWGYGISSGLSGGFVDINSEVVWDLSVIMHEIGHQFGSDHTHDSDGYSPVVDTCGTSCPPGLPLDDSTTLMSYCDFCDGGYSNLLYTFGGEYSGSGSRSSLSNWKNNPSLQGNISNNPKRVPYTMWSHVSSRGSCVQVTNQTPSPTPSPTQLPTAKPTIASPTQKPTTHAPTNVSATAVHDAQLGAPKCSSVGSVCDTGTLVNGRAGLSGGQEPNGSNTIDTCNDGSSGSYHSDESIDRVVVKTADGSDFKAGSLVTIDATVYAYDDGSSDYADFYYTSDANNPVWSHIGTKQPTGGGIQILSSQYVVPSGGSVTQAVRVVFKYVDSNSATVACPGGAYDDVDDVVFTLSMGGVPTKNPTSPPTSLPTMAPSQKPTSIPTLVPTPALTQKPTATPPTQKPSNKPTIPPTKNPTNTSGNTASYDSQFGAPKCSSVGSVCDTGTLVNGRAGLSGGQEPNGSNTIDTCNDGSSGSYHSDESIDRVVVKTADGSDFKAGSLVTIDATVYAYDDGSSDYADFYYTSDANNPVWSHIGTKQPTGGGIQILSSQYVVPSGGSVTQAVRVVFKYVDSNSATVACPGGAYDDVDDVVFTLSMGGVPTKIPTNTPTLPPTMAPTQNPTSKPTTSPTNLPTHSGGTQPLISLFDSQLDIPSCKSIGISCDSGELLVGRSSVGPEPNLPNSLDTCMDGNRGTFHVDESVDRVLVKTKDGSPLARGKFVTIEATVFAYGDGSNDFADFYYTTDAFNPSWVFIGTKTPPGGGSRTLSADYTVPTGGAPMQAVRVNFRYGGSRGASTTCVNGNYNDVDDLAFQVA